jgi:hypothetical protein
MPATAWMSLKATGPAAREIDAAEVRRAAEILFDPMAGVELRGLPFGATRRLRGDDIEGVIGAAANLTEDGATGVYYMMNPQLHGYRGSGNAASVLRRRWLLIDVDPIKPDERKDDPPTREERMACVGLAGRVRLHLDALGWPAPVEVDSGGGMHLLYRVELPNDDESKLAIKAFLARLAAAFPDGGKIDPKVYDAPRIAKLPGTWSLRGKASADRPHRMARLVRVPEIIARVSPEQIRSACQDVTETVVDAPACTVHTAPDPNATPPAWLRKACTGDIRPDTWDRATAYVRECPAAVSGSGGHGQTMSVARGVVCGFGLGFQVGYDLLQAHYNPRCVPPWSERELRHKCEDAERTPDPAGRPWGYLLKEREEQPPAAPPLPSTEEEAAELRGRITRISDLIQAGAEVRWLWPQWIPTGVLTLLAAEGGTGKTRFCADLLRRIRHGLPWPDGQAMNLPPDTPTLWVLADNHHDEMVTLAREFGVEGNVWINSEKSAPYDGTSLDLPADLAAMERRIQAVRPAIVFIDTVGNSTDRNLSRQEDAKAYYEPLQVIARRNRTALLCLTHLNAGGTVLGRRALEKVRCTIRMSKPDPAEPNRRKLEVVKSNAKYPTALGVTMGDRGNEYDTDPPLDPAIGPGAGSGNHASKRGPIPAKTAECMEWLRLWLASGAKRVSDTRKAAENASIGTSTLYAAFRELGGVEATVQERKWWSLPPADIPD